MNTARAVPRNRPPNPIKARGRGLLLLATVGLGVLGTSVLSALAGGAGAFGAGARVLACVEINVVRVDKLHPERCSPP